MAVGARSRFLPSQYHLILILVTGAAAGVTAISLAHLLTAPEPVAWWRMALGVGCLMIGPVPLLHVRYGHHTGDHDLSEAAVVIGLALLPAQDLIVITAAIVPAVHAVLGRPPVKVLFNGASATIGVAVAAGVLWLQGGHAGHLGATTVVLAAAAGLAFCLWTSLSVSLVISTAQGMPLRRTLRETTGISTVIAAGGIVVGCGSVALAYTSPVTLVVLPPVLASLVMVYRMHVNSSRQRDRWRQLNAAAKDLAVLDGGTIETAASRIAYEIFQPDGVELTVDSTAVAPPPQRADRHRRVDDVTIALSGPTGQVGVLRLRFGEPTIWQEHEQAVLAAFANLVALAVANASTYAEAHEQACHDALTGLGNRRMLQRRTAEAIAGTTAAGPRFALLLVDLDRFREVNDTLGHDAGDRLLRGIADRLQRAVRAGDLVTRVGGDEFAVLLAGIRDAEAADTVAATIAKALARPVSFEGMLLSVEASVGVACFPEDGRTVDELLRRADVAMYQAKRAHSGYRRYRADEDSSTLAHMELVADLHGALAEGDISLHYQPQIDLGSGRIVAVEALARWRHRTRGLLTPATFIGAVEQSGLIGDFTRAVLGEALSACGRWRAGSATIRLSVNLFARNLLEADLATEIAQLLLANSVPASALTLEVTERAVVMDSATTAHSFAALRDLGVRLAVDDFGTGYSALNVLRQFDPHEVKIDQSFTGNLTDNPDNAAIVRATINLAHDLGLLVVAEGVEDLDTMNALTVLGCDLAQGRFIRPPCPAEEITALLRDAGRLTTPHSADVLPFPTAYQRSRQQRRARSYQPKDARS
ncbi:bifunctional diguanylate cyclase/phosphodiesterase [Frankia sp. Cj3]|uniref:putative bifunctional diguanylate cyclase/phosphodiesterase n=1 Tax=Frankia sp. Cj3 TaxID=2880976 RepID=UPI001EF6C0E3|nr:EAL domain-containing protein [Frankia sp. Cj3]